MVMDLESSFYVLIIAFCVILVLLVVLFIAFIRIRKVSKEVAALRKETNSAFKRQLTQNISHELKTPVSSIKGYLETIIENPEMDVAMKTAFVNRSFEQTIRLSNLLKDLSTITRMDELFDKIDKSQQNLSKIVKEVIQDGQVMASSKNIKLENHLPDNLVINGNESLLYSIFYNLVDNSIAYSSGDKIVIELINNNKIRYYDNGVGIPEEHIPRIFERFYRVDKGRSRKMGGTGLGLSIVKNAVLIHGGSISVRNRKEGGAEFIFTLYG